MLRDIFKDNIANHIIDFEEYSPYPRCKDREAWDKIPKKYTKAVCEKAQVSCPGKRGAKPADR